MIQENANYFKKIMEWFDKNSNIKMTSSAYGSLGKQIKGLSYLYPLKAVYYSLSDVEKNKMNWIDKVEFKSPFAFIKYVLKTAEDYHEKNAERVEREKRENNVEVDFDIVFEQDKTGESKNRKVKDISKFL